MHITVFKMQIKELLGDKQYGLDLNNDDLTKENVSLCMIQPNLCQS